MTPVALWKTPRTSVGTSGTLNTNGFSSCFDTIVSVVVAVTVVELAKVDTLAVSTVDWIVVDAMKNSRFNDSLGNPGTGIC